MILSRRRALQALSVLPAAGFVGAMPRVARAAEFSLKYGNNLPLTHPLNIRAQEAADRIAKETNGRVEIKIFPNNQLGGDTDMLAQVRSGGSTSSRRRRWSSRRWCRSPRSMRSASPSPTTTRSGRRWTASSAPMSAPRSRRSACMPSRRCGTTASARSPAAPSRSRAPRTWTG